MPPPQQEPVSALEVWTVGHSNRSLEAFLSLLDAFGIGAVADVRRYPGSRKFPHFGREALRDALEVEGIRYRWFEALGGRRHGAAREDSPNTGLKSAGFRNYADYMMTEPCEEAVDRLLGLAHERPTAVMCAEKFYWKCHRRLLSDTLVARGVTVQHILGPDQLRPHRMTPGATVTEEGTVVYR